MHIDIDHLKTWVGRSETVQDTVTTQPLVSLSNTLDRPRAGVPAAVPPLWHWLNFLPNYRHAEAGPDGHIARGGPSLAPPVPLPRRMWAGSRLTWHAPLAVGDAISRTSTVKSVEHKAGKTGDLVFVLVHHAIHRGAQLVMDEEHDIVFRDITPYVAPQAVPQAQWRAATWTREVHGDTLMLFRYSALTFNGHRIHYDRDYTVHTEGYPGLIVHGPLMATWLMEVATANNPTPTVKTFKFRALSPVFDLNPFTVCGAPTAQGCEVWIRRHDGVVAMEGVIEWA